MKVLFITRGFPSKTDPMAGNYEAVQAKAIAAKGHQVSVISVYDTSVNGLFKWSQITHRIVESVNVYESIYPTIQIRFVRKINKYLRKAAYRCTFKRFLSEQGMPEIVHAHIISTASFAIFIKEKYHLPFIITEHWTKTNVSEIPLWLKRMSATYKKADGVICVSDILAESLKRNFNVDSIVINNMVSDQFFKSIKNIKKDNIFRFIACGAFRDNGNKGFDILVEAFAQAHFPKCVILEIIGDGEDRPFIESIIAKYDISKQIHLLGVKTPEEVNELLCNSDCFVLSSRLETFAIVVIEAMAKGLPVIATRCGGPETFLRPEHGLLIEKENVKELADGARAAGLKF